MQTVFCTEVSIDYLLSGVSPRARILLSIPKA
jgi:hypothetical protein